MRSSNTLFLFFIFWISIQNNSYAENHYEYNNADSSTTHITMHIVSASDDITGKDGDWELEVGKANEVIGFDHYPSNLQSSSATYSSGDIPTGENAWPGGCTASTLQVTIPAGSEVTGVDVVYDMTAVGQGFMSDQRSQIYYVEGAVDEGGFSSGVGDMVGTMPYSRSGLFLANGVSNTGVLTFEMRAYRTFGTGCNTTLNKVDNSTWSITVHYQNVTDPCDPVASGNIDTDGDNITDICDLDDDNDGILDTDETVSYTCSEITPINFSSPSLESGTALTTGAVYRFSSIKTGVDALVSVDSMSAPGALGAFDDDGSNVNNFQPVLSTPESAVYFTMDFVVSGTSTPIDIGPFVLTPLDVDGDNTTARERVTIDVELSDVLLENPTNVSLSHNNGLTEIIGETTVEPGIGVTATNVMASTKHNFKNKLYIKIGVDPTSGVDRQFSIT